MSVCVKPVVVLSTAVPSALVKVTKLGMPVMA
jgi:hypothetical protein